MIFAVQLFGGAALPEPVAYFTARDALQAAHYFAERLVASLPATWVCLVQVKESVSNLATVYVIEAHDGDSVTIRERGAER